MNEGEQLDSQLQEEYKILSSRWDDFDRRALSLKGWLSAGFLVALADLTGKDRPLALFDFVILAGVITSVWFMEAIWRSWHHSYGARIIEIEKHFRERTTAQLTPFQIEYSWTRAYGVNPENRDNKLRFKKVFEEFFRLQTLIPYLPVIVALGFLWLRGSGFLELVCKQIV